MSIEEKKRRMARNYAINSKKTPKARRMAFARAHAGGITITDPVLAAKLKYYVPDYDPSDHIIIAHAITEKLTLLSSDEKFPFYREQGLDLIEY